MRSWPGTTSTGSARTAAKRGSTPTTSRRAPTRTRRFCATSTNSARCWACCGRRPPPSAEQRRDAPLPVVAFRHGDGAQCRPPRDRVHLRPGALAARTDQAAAGLRRGVRRLGAAGVRAGWRLERRSPHDRRLRFRRRLLVLRGLRRPDPAQRGAQGEQPEGRRGPRVRGRPRRLQGGRARPCVRQGLVFHRPGRWPVRRLGKDVV